MFFKRNGNKIVIIDDYDMTNKYTCGIHMLHETLGSRSSVQLGYIKCGIVCHEFFPVYVVIVKLCAGQQEITGIVLN